MIETFIVTALAVYGVAYSVTQLDGPFDLFVRLRGWGINRNDWFGHGLQCPICLSFWIGLLVAVTIHGFSWTAFVWAWAYTGIVVIIQVWLNRLRAAR